MGSFDMAPPPVHVEHLVREGLMRKLPQGPSAFHVGFKLTTLGKRVAKELARGGVICTET